MPRKKLIDKYDEDPLFTRLLDQDIYTLHRNTTHGKYNETSNVMLGTLKEASKNSYTAKILASEFYIDPKERVLQGIMPEKNYKIKYDKEQLDAIKKAAPDAFEFGCYYEEKEACPDYSLSHISDTLDQLSELLDSGDSVFHGSSSAYKSIQKNINVLKNTINRAPEQAKNISDIKSFALQRYVRVMVNEIRDQAEAYVEAHAEIEQNDRPKSYKGRRAMIMREVLGRMSAINETVMTHHETDLLVNDPKGCQVFGQYLHNMNKLYNFDSSRILAEKKYAKIVRENIAYQLNDNGNNIKLVDRHKAFSDYDQNCNTLYSHAQKYRYTETFGPISTITDILKSSRESDSCHVYGDRNYSYNTERLEKYFQDEKAARQEQTKGHSLGEDFATAYI